MSKKILSFLAAFCFLLSGLAYAGPAAQKWLVIGSGPAETCTASVTTTNSTMSQYSGTSFSNNTPENLTSNANTAFVLLIAFDGADSTVDSCSVGGNGMTQIGTTSTNGNLRAAIFYRMNPGTGSLAYGCSGTSVSEWYYGGFFMQNVNSASPVRTGSYQPGTSNSLTISSNSQDMSISVIEATSSTTSSNQTYDRTSAGSYSAGLDHATTPAASVAHTWTAEGTMVMAGASIKCKTD